MNYPKRLVQLTAVFFIIYGLLFAIFPVATSLFVTGSAPNTPSGLIDLRATYGGMSLAAGIIMLTLAQNPATLRLALNRVILVMMAMATTRTIGIFLDGQPNGLMYIYLAAELLVASSAFYFHQNLDAEQ